METYSKQDCGTAQHLLSAAELPDLLILDLTSYDCELKILTTFLAHHPSIQTLSLTSFNIEKAMSILPARPPIRPSPQARRYPINLPNVYMVDLHVEHLPQLSNLVLPNLQYLYIYCNDRRGVISSLRVPGVRTLYLDININTMLDSHIDLVCLFLDLRELRLNPHMITTPVKKKVFNIINTLSTHLGYLTAITCRQDAWRYEYNRVNWLKL